MDDDPKGVTMAPRFRIYSGTHEQARHLANEMKLDRTEWGFVSSEEFIMGLRKEVLLCYGTWRDRVDMMEVMSRARVQEMKILYIH